MTTGHRLLALLLVVLPAGTAGCDRSPGRAEQVSDSNVVPAIAPSAADTGAARVAQAGGVRDESRRGCADLHAVFAAAAKGAGLAAEGVQGPRDTTMSFGGLDQEPTEAACVVAWKDSRSARAPFNELLAGAKARGWTPRDHLLSADGPDGTVLAISRGGAACVLEMHWDGDDDSDSTYVPAPGFAAMASCFPDRPDRY